jgi:hypothetical protein
LVLKSPLNATASNLAASVDRHIDSFNCDMLVLL